MKILWLSNKELTLSPTFSTGTWLQTMALGLNECLDIELCNITMGHGVKTTIQRDCGTIKQWIIPKTKLVNGLPNVNIINDICSIIEKFSPDLIHIWGVESFWGLLSARGYINHPVLLEIQGLRYTCAESFYGGMSFHDIFSSVCFMDFVVPRRRIDRQQASHKAWGKYEKEMLSYHEYISTQSEWVRSAIRPYCNDRVRIFKTKMAVRSAFMESKRWQYRRNNNIQLLSISSTATPYKGVHVVLKAVALLKKNYPTIKLKLVGEYMQDRPYIYKLGYVQFIERTIKKLNLENNVVFAGSLSEVELEAEMQQSSVVIHSSFVETYSLALAESMAVGVPSVISYAGAMSELAQNEISGVYYSPSDYYKCASLIAKLIEDEQFARKISINARELALTRNNTKNVIATQREIYDAILTRS